MESDGGGRVCAFTGHRIEKLPWRENEDDPRCRRLKRCIFDAAEAVYYSGVRHYICGMATGCDLYFCEAVLSLRERCPDAVLEAAIPCESQPDAWPESLRRRYAALLEQCDLRTVVSQSYTRDCMMRRNRYMVDACDVLIAAYNGCSGGTRATLLYAMRRGKQIIQLPWED